MIQDLHSASLGVPLPVPQRTSHGFKFLGSLQQEAHCQNIGSFPSFYSGINILLPIYSYLYVVGNLLTNIYIAFHQELNHTFIDPSFILFGLVIVNVLSFSSCNTFALGPNAH